MNFKDIKAIVFDNQDWRLLRWDKNCLGYRPVVFGATLNKDDNILMALQLDTDVFPSEGLEYVND